MFTTLFIIVIRKQIAFGFKEPGENADAQVFLKQMFSRLTEMLDCRELNLFCNNVIIFDDRSLWYPHHHQTWMVAKI